MLPPVHRGGKDLQMPRVRARALAIVIALATASMLFAPPAGASRAANANQLRALTNAVHASKVGGLNKVPQSHYRVTGGLISTISKNWAMARLVARPAFRSSFQNAIVVAVRPGGTNQWVVVDLGTADVGCG